MTTEEPSKNRAVEADGLASGYSSAGAGTISLGERCDFSTALELRAGAALDEPAWEELLRRSVFECCKWNLSSGDVPVLCRYPLHVSAGTYARLARTAEWLAAEVLGAERELRRRPELMERLGLSEGLRHALASAPPQEGPRFLRVDFHPTPSGVAITEANTDVAGGFAEASGVSAIMAELLGTRALGDPAGRIADALRAWAGQGARVGLMHLTRYTDDRQVVAYLARRFEAAGLAPVLFDASHLRPGLRADPGDRALEAVFRFFPGDWLEQLPPAVAWPALFRDPRVCNPLTALLTQSKRLPLVWDELDAPLPTWRALMPETRAVDDEVLANPAWVLKPAFGHEGLGVVVPGTTAPRLAHAVGRLARRSPSEWVAQRRFEFEPIPTPDGLRHACLGIHVIDGEAVGAYGRVSRSPIIDDASQDAVLLVETP